MLGEDGEALAASSLDRRSVLKTSRSGREGRVADLVSLCWIRSGFGGPFHVQRS